MTPHRTTPEEKAPLAPQGISGVFAPITLARPTDILPHAYILHVHSQKCLACGTEHSWTKLYAWNRLKTRLGEGRMVENLVPVDTFLYNIPIKTIPTKQEHVPACFECVDRLDLSKLPNLEDTEAWKSIQNRKTLEAMAAIKNAPANPFDTSTADNKKKHPLTTNEILDLI